MRTLTLRSASEEQLREALARPLRDLGPFRDRVRPIIREVRRQGDRAVRTFTRTFDEVDVEHLRATDAEVAAAPSALPVELLASIQKARENIERFHQEDRQDPWVETMPGVVCRREVRPLLSVGLYVPGGTAALFSTALMLTIPARLAGVARIALCSPPGREGRVPAAILAVCSLVGINEVYAMGGAQAIAAFAYGTESIAKVDKVLGPGNGYVAATKAEVSIDPNAAAIDMIAGPSELLIIADSSAEAAFVAADLLAQAEHDELAQVVLVVTSSTLLEAVRQQMADQLASMPRKEIASRALANSSAILASTLEEAIDVANRYAPEHLSIQTAEPAALVPRIHNAGSIFLGPYSPGTAGDYCSGTNHVLPTSGGARVQSGVSLRTFQKIITVQELSRDGLNRLARTATTMARAEGLEAHARAVEIRFGDGLADGVPETLGGTRKIVGPGAAASLNTPAIPAHIASLEPYESARSLLKGNGWTFLDANESAFSAVCGVTSLGDLNRYPDPSADSLRDTIADYYGLDRANMIIGNGSDELIELAVRAFVRRGGAVMGTQITYGMYKVSAAVNGVPYRFLSVDQDYQVDELSIAWNDDADILFLCNPNNPTGTVTDSRRIERVIESFEGLVVIDEAYGEFADAEGVPSSIQLVAQGAKNLLVLRTFSKAFGAAGIRLGYGVTCPAVVSGLLKVKPPYNVSALSQAVGLELWQSRERMEQNISRLKQKKQKLIEECTNLGCKIMPSVTNFFLLRPPPGVPSQRVYDILSNRFRIVLRQIKGLPDFLRVTVGGADENDYFISSLAAIL